MPQLDFNSDDHEPVQNDLLPRGEYKATVVASEMKETRSGGEMLRLEFQILEGQFLNRKVWENYNLVNISEQAVRIGKGQLSSLCRAIGVGQMKDSSELHYKPLKITVGVKKASDSSYGDQNKITNYAALPSGTDASVRQVPELQSNDQTGWEE
jgi:hypothetical protein